MQDNHDLEITKKQGYESETASWNKLYNEVVEKAYDKQFAVKYAFGLFYLAYRINNTGTLSKRVITHYETCYKLGFTVTEVILSILDVIKGYNQEARHYWEANRKKIRKVKLSFQKNNWGLPLIWKPLKVNIKQEHTPYSIAGPFATICEPVDIARELGKTKAREDFLQFLKDRYKEYGGDIRELQVIPKSEEDSRLNLLDYLDNEDLNRFIDSLSSTLASIPYQIAGFESIYHSLVHATLSGAGANIISEYPTNTGRIDSVIETEKTIYILEFKLDSKGALKQINQKKYFESFLNKKKRIILIGIYFCSQKRNIKDWEYQVIDNLLLF
jgi:hypothetical protein